MSPNDNNQVVNILPLAYALNLLSQFLPIPTHIFKNDGHYYEKFDNGQDDEWNVFKTDYEFRKKIINKTIVEEVTLITEDNPVIFGGVKCTDELTLVIGPAVLNDVDQNFCKLYAMKHKANNVALYKCDAKKIASFLLLIYSSISNKYIYLSDFLDKYLVKDDFLEKTQKKIAQVFSKQIIETKPHNPASFENDIRAAIRNGDVEQLKKALNSIYANMRGTLARNSLRSAQNLAIVDITLASREAINAGLNVEEMYVISDAYILEVEDCKKAEDAAALARACALRCAQLVARYKREIQSYSTSSAVVMKACDYLDRHIYEKFDLEKMSQKLKISSGYLSKMFKLEKKITLGEYLRNRKIEIAKSLLLDSEHSIDEIAIMLSFSSQSHFGRVFSQVVGVSPARFRNQNAINRTVF